LNSKQYGFINFGTMTLLIGGLALAWLLLRGMQGGHELPLWPALAVAAVNIVAAVKLIYDVKKARQLRQAAPPAAESPAAPDKSKSKRR
jgi:hypothetical protein